MQLIEVQQIPRVIPDAHISDALMKTYIEEAVASIVVLVVALGALGWIVRPAITPLRYVGIDIGSFLGLVWLAVLAGSIIYGIMKDKPGFILAPFIFTACWFGASVAAQWRLQASVDPKVRSAPISSEASSQRTLIVDAYRIVNRRIIADGHVDRLVKVRRDGSTHKIIGIEEISSAEGDECSLQEKQASPQLGTVGRSDACFKRRDLSEIPDGLVVENIERLETGCCSETQARLRVGGEERLLFSWFQGYDYALSPLPQFNWVGGAFMRLVRYGLEDIRPTRMVSAIYGVKPAYNGDNDDGVRAAPASLSANEALDRAHSLAKLPDVSMRAVASLLTGARDKGVVDERTIDIAAACVGHDTEGWLALSDYARGLTIDQTEVLIEKVLQRLETPNICKDCLPSQNFVAGRWQLKERLSHPEQLADRARRIFQERTDLAAWQYEGCLRIIAALGPQDYPASENFQQQTMFPMVLTERTVAFSDKAIAYLRTIRKAPSDARTELAAKLDLVRDEDLREYIRTFWRYDLTSLIARNGGPQTFAQAARACERISRISDLMLRALDFQVDCDPERTASRQRRR